MLHFRRQTWRKSLIVFNSFKCYQKHPVPARYITIWREIWSTDIVIKNLGKCMHCVCQDNTCNTFLSIHELLIGPQHVNIANGLPSQNNAVYVFVGAGKEQSAKTNLIMTYLQCSDVFESHNCHTLIYYDVMSRSIHRYVALCLVLIGTHKSTHPNQNQNKNKKQKTNHLQFNYPQNQKSKPVVRGEFPPLKYINIFFGFFTQKNWRSLLV